MHLRTTGDEEIRDLEEVLKEEGANKGKLLQEVPKAPIAKQQAVLLRSRLAFRVSSAAALKLRRLAQHHERTLRVIGVNSVQFDLHQASSSNSAPLIRITHQSSSPEQLTKRRALLQQLRQQQQLLIQQTQQQQQFAAAALQQRNSVQHRANKTTQGAAFSASAIKVAPPSQQKRPVSVTPVRGRPSQSSLPQQKQKLLEHPSSSSSPSSSAVTPVQRTPPSSTYPHQLAQPSCSASTSAAAVFQHMDQQQSGSCDNNNGRNSLMLAAQQSTPQTNQPSNVTSGIAENSPLLVNLLSNNQPSDGNFQQSLKQQQQHPQNVMPSSQTQQQQAMLAANQQQQQQRIAALQQQCYSTGIQGQQAQPMLPHQSQNSQQLVVNSQQQHMYQQQQRLMQQQQQQQMPMMYGGVPSGMIPGPGTPQSHYMIVGNSPPSGSSPSAYHRIAMQSGVQHLPGSGGMVVASPPGSQPPPYYGMPPMQQTGATPPQMMVPSGAVVPAPLPSSPLKHAQLAAGCSTAVLQTSAEEPTPKKRKRISKKQQQKEEREREQQQLQQMRLQEQQQQQAMVAFRQQQMAYMQHQHRMAAMSGVMPQQICGIPPVQQNGGILPQGQIHLPATAQQKHYQQQIYQQHPQQYAAQAIALKQQSANPGLHGNFHSPPTGVQYAVTSGQRNSPMSNLPQQQQFVIPMQQPQQMVNPGQQQNHHPYIISPQHQQAIWSNQMTPVSMKQLQQNPTSGDCQNMMAIGTVVTQSQQQHSQQQQTVFRTPGTPQYYGQSPTTNTQFHSPPPQQMVGTPLGVGNSTPTCGTHPMSSAAVGGGPTTPQSCAVPGNAQHHSGPVTPSGTHEITGCVGTPQQHSLVDANSVQQHHTQNHLMQQQQQQMMTANQQQHYQMSQAEFYHQQQRFQRQKQQNQTAIIPNQQQPAFNPQLQQATARTFPQLSDFADGSIDDPNDLDNVVPGISNEGIDDIDLDSIEPMRYGGENHHQQQNEHQRQQQQQQKEIAVHQQQTIQTQQNLTPNFCKAQFSQPQQNGLSMGQKLTSVQIKNVKSPSQNMAEMTDAEQRNVAEMALIPVRSPQVGDTPLSPSKLSETQDRNVSDAIASVMERVAKTGGTGNGQQRKPVAKDQFRGARKRKTSDILYQREGFT